MTKSAKDLEAAVTAELKELGGRIKQLRDFRRLTLHTVAERAGVGVQTLVRIEEGSPGVALLNLQKVLTVLGAPATFLAAGVPPAPVPPVLPLYDDSEAVSERVAKAAALACQELAKLTRKSSGGLDTDLEHLIQRRLMELLTGHPGVPLTNSELPAPLLYSDEQVGGPPAIEGAKPAGWVVRLRESRQLLDLSTDSGVATLDAAASTQVLASRSAGLQAIRAFLAARGALPGPVDVVPVYKDGAALRF